MKLKLSELLSRYGDETVQFQKLDDCTENLSMTKRGTRASFVTTETFGYEGFDKLGLIVWLDRERAAKIIAEWKATAHSSTHQNSPGESS